MKQTLLTFLFCTFILLGCGKEETKAHSDFIPNPDAADHVPTEEPEEMQITKTGFEVAKQLAISLLNIAAEQSSPPESRLFQSLSQALSTVHFDLPPPGQDLRQCVRDKAVLAFVMVADPKTIHVCARSLKGTNNKKLSQVLIHEASHTIGVHDECMATKIEISVMRVAAKGLAFRNGYMDRCGLR